MPCSDERYALFNDDASRIPARPVHVKRDGTVVYGKEPIGRVIREVDGWSPAELNGDYLGITTYPRQYEATLEVVKLWKGKWLAAHPRRTLNDSAARRSMSELADSSARRTQYHAK